MERLKSIGRNILFYILFLVGNFRWPLVFLLSIWLLSEHLTAITWHQLDWSLLLQYIESMKWPVFWLLAIAIYRNSLPGVLKGVAGRIVNFPTPMGNIGLTPIPPAQDGPQTPSKPYDEKVIESLEKEEKLVHPTQPIAPKGYEPSDEKKVLEVQLEFERVYRIIFGSQILALQRLDDFGKEGLRSSALEDFLRMHQDRVKAAQLTGQEFVSVLDFLAYLKRKHLVEYDPATDIFRITTAGRVFLDYLQDQGLGADRRPY